MGQNLYVQLQEHVHEGDDGDAEVLCYQSGDDLVFRNFIGDFWIRADFSEHVSDDGAQARCLIEEDIRIIQGIT